MRTFINRNTSLICFAALSLTGCAGARIHREEAELKKVFSEMCAPGTGVRESRGSAWIKISTTEESGQFPAQFHATAPSKLDIEVTNLVGSVEALIRIRADHYTVKWTGKETVEEEGSGAWRGIPLQWAVDLFRGQVPCPSLEALGSSREDIPRVRLVSEDNGDVSATVQYPGSNPVTEHFIYRVKEWSGKSWAESLKWKRDGVEPLEVEFKFEAPDETTASPTRVVAQSPLGEVKIRWKERRKVR
jgi:hypothetical protein